MKEALLTLLYSWGSDTPAEVIWGLNEILQKAKDVGFVGSYPCFKEELDPCVKEAEEVAISNSILAEQLGEFLDKKLKS